MQVPFGDMTDTIWDERRIDAAVSRVLASGWFVLGGEWSTFEEAFAAHFGVRQSIVWGSGTESPPPRPVACGVKPAMK